MSAGATCGVGGERASLAVVEPRLAFRIIGRLLLAAVCAVAAHVAAYRTLWPQDGLHGYLGWYEPLVAGLPLAATVGIAVFVVLARRARRRAGRVPFAITALPQRPLGSRIVGIGVSGLVYLIVQESVEQSAAAGSPQFASLTLGQWFAVFVAVVAAGLALACVLRLGEAVVQLVLRDSTPVPAGRRCAPAWSVTVGEVRRSRPLALRSALRAPPALPAA